MGSFYGKEPEYLGHKKIQGLRVFATNNSELQACVKYLITLPNGNVHEASLYGQVFSEKHMEDLEDIIGRELELIRIKYRK